MRPMKITSVEKLENVGFIISSLSCSDWSHKERPGSSLYPRTLCYPPTLRHHHTWHPCPPHTPPYTTESLPPPTAPTPQRTLLTPPFYHTVESSLTFTFLNFCFIWCCRVFARNHYFFFFGGTGKKKRVKKIFRAPREKVRSFQVNSSDDVGW